MAYIDGHMALRISNSVEHVPLHWGNGICADPIHSSINITAI